MDTLRFSTSLRRPPFQKKISQSPKQQMDGAIIGENTPRTSFDERGQSYVPGSKLLILGMVIPPLIGSPYNGYINPYYKVDDYPYHRKTMGV